MCCFISGGVEVSYSTLRHTGTVGEEEAEMCVWAQDGRRKSRIEKIIHNKGKGNRPGVAQRVPGGSGSQISMTFST
jgi:hypothetical protein